MPPNPDPEAKLNSLSRRLLRGYLVVVVVGRVGAGLPEEGGASRAGAHQVVSAVHLCRQVSGEPAREDKPAAGGGLKTLPQNEPCPQPPIRAVLASELVPSRCHIEEGAKTNMILMRYFKKT